MTHVDWHPVQVNSFGKIIKGKRPADRKAVFITYKGGIVDVELYINDVDGFKRAIGTIIAWADIEAPDPYEPEGKE